MYDPPPPVNPNDLSISSIAFCDENGPMILQKAVLLKNVLSHVLNTTKSITPSKEHLLIWEKIFPSKTTFENNL